MKNNLDILELYKLFKENRKIILKVTIIFFIFSNLYVLSKPNYYESNISLYAAGELDDSSLLGQYGGLAQNLGISMVPSSNYYIPDILDSRNLKKEIILRKWDAEEFEHKVNLIEYWNIDKPSILSKSTSFIKNLFVKNKYVYKETRQLNAAIEKLSNLISVDEKNSGLIEVTVFLEEPVLAADIANYISAYLVDFIKEQQKVFADKSKVFILDRMNLAEIDLAASEIELMEFRKVNPLVLDTPDLQLDRARLSRSVEVNQQVFITLREQLEIAKIESNKERLYINILDKAYANPSKAKPKRLLLILIITLCGFIMSVLFQVVILNFKRIKEK